MEKQIKEMRVEIDRLSQLTSNTEYSSRQVNQSVNKLLLAKAWLGKMLQEVGIENPYKQDAKTTAEITPTQDVAPKEDSSWIGQKHLEQVNILRSMIEDVIKTIVSLNNNKDPKLNLSVSREFAIARTNCYNYLCEAKFMLGFELQRIKD